MPGVTTKSKGRRDPELQPALPAPRSRRCSLSPATTRQALSSSWAAAMAPSTTWVSSSFLQVFPGKWERGEAGCLE